RSIIWPISAPQLTASWQRHPRTCRERPSPSPSMRSGCPPRSGPSSPSTPSSPVVARFAPTRGALHPPPSSSVLRSALSPRARAAASAQPAFGWGPSSRQTRGGAQAVETMKRISLAEFGPVVASVLAHAGVVCAIALAPAMPVRTPVLFAELVDPDPLPPPPAIRPAPVDRRPLRLPKPLETPMPAPPPMSRREPEPPTPQAPSPPPPAPPP